jgi:hypothetical protein
MMLPVLNDAPGEVPPPDAERIGNVAREEAAILAEFMDNNLSDALDDATYSVDYKFDCSLSEDLNHKAEGYKIEIILYSKKSGLWTNQIIDLLKSMNIDAIKIVN